MTAVPTWAVYTISIATPLSAFVGAILGHWLLRKGATELDVWRRREETMRMLRWASEQAASSDPARAVMGVAALDALSTSELLQTPDQGLVDTVIDSILAAALEELDRIGDDSPRVVEIDSG